MKNAVVVSVGIVAVLCLAGVVVYGARGDADATPAPVVDRTESAASRATPFHQSPFEPLPLDAHFDPAKVALGDRLFHDQRLSSDGTISCASCHDLDRGGADDRRYSRGVGGNASEVNTPTVFNGGYNFRQFWDGRADSLEQQIDGPLLHPSEMATTWNDLLTFLRGEPGYARSFAEIYDSELTAENVRDAIAVFERSLITPNARFDRFLRGDATALSPDELAGFRLFTDIGCVTCHQGINVGGNMFQMLGRMGNYFEDRGDIESPDYGRFNVTGEERDRFKFKVPSLRNVELTAPYLHDGSAPTLESAVQIMARYQIGTELRDGEMGSLVAFLRTLTGENPRRK